jgi:PKD repeat protein
MSFSEAGSYDVTLVIEDAFGLQSTPFTQSINVSADTNGISAKAYFNASPFTDFSGITLFNRSIAGDGAISEIYYLIDGIRYDSLDFTYGSRLDLPLSHDGDLDIEIFVTDDLGNTSSFQKTVVMDNTIKPVVLFDLAQSDNLTVYLKGIDSYDPMFEISSMTIDWGDGNSEFIDPINFYLTHNYIVAGNYDVTMTINTHRGESTSLTKTVSITDSTVPAIDPTALFEVVQDPTLGHVRLYVSQSGTPNGLITGYNWEMGDGNVIQGLDQVAYFYDVGIYPVTLTITDESGLTASQTQTIIITENGDPLVISANCNTDSNNLFVGCLTYVGHRFAQFDNLQVDWGDGSVENIAPTHPYFSAYENLGHTYSEAGNYTITFHAIAANGDSAIVTRDVYFSSGNMRPIGNVSCQTNGMSVTCNSMGSYDPDGFITNYEYEVLPGVNVFSQDGNMTYTYQSPGTYHISMVAYDQFGLDSVPITVSVVIEQVNSPPVAILSCVSNGPRQISCHANSSYDPDGSIISYEYDLDDENIFTKVTPAQFSFTYDVGGAKNVSLLVTDNNGATHLVSETIQIQENSNPVANFFCNVNGDKTLDCDASASSDPEGDQLVYYWSFFDHLEEGTVMASNTYSNYGDVTVKLRVEDTYGFSDEKSFTYRLIDVISDPFAVISTRINHELKLVELDGSKSKDGGKEVVQYEWTIQGSPSSITTSDDVVFYTFPDFGTYEIALKVTDGLGRTSMANKTITLFDFPVPDPGESDYDFIEGIDTDLDGVRDDLQRWIIAKSKDSDVLDSLRRLSIIAQQIAVEGNSNGTAITNLSNFEQEEKCLRSFYENFNDFYEIIRTFKSNVFNNRSRLKNYLITVEEFAGKVIDIETNSARLNRSCPSR